MRSELDTEWTVFALILSAPGVLIAWKLGWALIELIRATAQYMHRH